MQFKTNRLILSQPSLDFAIKRRDFYLNNRDFFKPFMPIQSHDIADDTFHYTKLEREIDFFDTQKSFKFYIFQSNDVEKIIGAIEFSQIELGPFRSCCLGYVLDEKVQGNGYMQEALKKAIDFVLNEKKLHRVQAAIMPSNHQSINVIQKLGFEQIGLAKNYLNINGSWSDHLLYQLISPELF